MFPGAPNAQAGVGLNAPAGPLKLRGGRGVGDYIQLEIAQKGRRAAASRSGLPTEHGGKIQALGHQQPVYRDVPTHRASLSGAGEAQIAGGEPTHADRIANARLAGGRTDIESGRAAAVGKRSGEQDLAAANAPRDVVKNQPAGVEGEISLDPTQPRWKVSVTDRTTVDMDTAGNARIGNRAGKSCVQNPRAASIEIGYESAKQLQIYVAVDAHIESAIAAEPRQAGDAEIGVRAAQIGLLDANLAMGELKPDRAGILELDVFIVEQNSREI